METMSFSEIAEQCEKNIRVLHETRETTEHVLAEIRKLDLLRRIRFGVR